MGLTHCLNSFCAGGNIEETVALSSSFADGNTWGEVHGLNSSCADGKTEETVAHLSKLWY